MEELTKSEERVSLVKAVVSSGEVLLPFEQELEAIKILIKSESLPKDCKTPEQVYMKWAYGAELGFKKVQSLHWLTNISGTITANAKGVGQLLKLHDYTFKIKKDAEFIYGFRDKEVLSPRPLTAGELVPRLSISKEEWEGFSADTQLLIKTPKDRVTTLEYGLCYKEGGIVKTEWIGEISYYWSDALEAKLSEKDTYKNYPKRMMIHRCKTSLASMLGILTCPETEEYAVARGIEDTDYTVIPD
jgi:hypothetical protein